MDHHLVITIDESDVDLETYLHNIMDIPRTTSRYSPDKLIASKLPPRTPVTTHLSSEYTERITQRFGGQHSPYINIMANAHLHDIIKKLNSIKDSRKGKIISSKDLHTLFDLEGITIIQ